jgi:hypothetical protein
MMTMPERDLTIVRNKLARASQAILEARGSLASRESRGPGDILRDIDQFTAREACTVLAALRVLQVIQGQDGCLPAEIGEGLSRCTSGAMTRLAEMDHFETEAPLNVTELDYLCERIAVDFSR